MRRLSLVAALALAATLLTAVPGSAVYDGAVRLSGAMPATADVSHFEMSPDGRWAVFAADRATNDVIELWSVRLDGTPGEPIRLTDPPVAGGNVIDFSIAPDSTRVVWRGDLLTDGDIEVFTAPIGSPGGQVRLNPPTGTNVITPRFTPDSSRVVYLQGGILFSALADGSGGATPLSDPPAGTGSVAGFRVSPDSARVAYSGDLLTDGEMEVFSSPIASAGGQVRLNDAPPAAGGLSNAQSFEVTGTHVLYRGQFSPSGLDELYSAPWNTSGSQVQLSDTAVGGHVSGFDTTPDGATVVYSGDLHTANVEELYRAQVDVSGSQVRLSQPPVAGAKGVGHFRLTDDGTTAVFAGEMLVNGNVELFTVPVAGGTQLRLSQPPVADGDVNRFFLSPLGTHVVFVGDLRTNDVREVFSVPLGGDTEPVRLNDTPVAGGQVNDEDVAIAPDGSRAVFVGDLDTVGMREAYSAPIGRAGEQVKLNDPLPAGGEVGFSELRMPPDSSFVVYVADQQVLERTELWATSRGQLPPDGLARLAGADRYVTAAAIALDRFWPADVDTVYLATGLDYPDALAGGPLAARDGAPILLSAGGTLPDATAAALAALAPELVVALGGERAVPSTVLTAAGTAAGGASTERIWGSDRFGTAAAIAAEFGAVDTVHLATGLDFPDALAGGPLAARSDSPVLLTAQTSLPTATATSLGDLAPNDVVALGGAAAMSEAVLTEAAAAAGGAVTDRLSGPDRFATAAAIAAEFGPVEAVYVATGLDFPDALTGVPPAAMEGAPILLATRDTVPDATAAALDALPLRRVVVLGGTAVIGPEVATSLQARLE